MPAFLVEFDSNYGPERRLFTLDSYRPLQAQVTQILEELRLDGRIITGGPEDELGVYWNGQDVDQQLTPDMLGITAARPIQLRMRPRPAPPPVVEVAEASPVHWLAIVRPPLEGAIGALLAWLVTARFTDVLAPFRSADDVDVAVTAVMVVGIALALTLGRVLRRETTAAASWLRFLFSPVAALGTLLAIVLIKPVPTTAAFLSARVLAWGVALGLLSLLLAGRRLDMARAHPVIALAVGVITGVATALVLSLPGPTLIWQAIAFLVAGLGVGTAAFSYPMWLDTQSRRAVVAP